MCSPHAHSKSPYPNSSLHPPPLSPSPSSPFSLSLAADHPSALFHSLRDLNPLIAYFFLALRSITLSSLFIFICISFFFVIFFHSFITSSLSSILYFFLPSFLSGFLLFILPFNFISSFLPYCFLLLFFLFLLFVSVVMTVVAVPLLLLLFFFFFLLLSFFLLFLLLSLFFSIPHSRIYLDPFYSFSMPIGFPLPSLPSRLAHSSLSPLSFPSSVPYSRVLGLVPTDYFSASLRTIDQNRAALSGFFSAGIITPSLYLCVFPSLPLSINLCFYYPIYQSYRILSGEYAQTLSKIFSAVCS